jgi:hypothetical protein
MQGDNSNGLKKIKILLKASEYTGLEIKLPSFQQNLKSCRAQYVISMKHYLPTT